VYVEYDENITVACPGECTAMYITLETGATDRNAIYTGIVGENKLAFEYSIQAGDTTSDLDVHNADALVLGGFTIKDNAGNDAPTTLPVGSGTSGALANNKDIEIDTTAPTATYSGEPSDPSNDTVLDITVGGADVVTYKYKVEESAVVDCSDNAGYSAERLVAVKITDNISGLAEGSATLCLMFSLILLTLF